MIYLTFLQQHLWCHFMKFPINLESSSKATLFCLDFWLGSTAHSSQSTLYQYAIFKPGRLNLQQRKYHANQLFKNGGPTLNPFQSPCKRLLIVYIFSTWFTQPFSNLKALYFWSDQYTLRQSSYFDSFLVPLRCNGVMMEKQGQIEFCWRKLEPDFCYMY